MCCMTDHIDEDPVSTIVSRLADCTGGVRDADAQAVGESLADLRD